MQTELHPQDTTAKVNCKVLHGENNLSISLYGGISVITQNPSPVLGEPGHGLRIIDLHLEGNSLIIDADIPTQGSSTIEIETDWGIIKANGAILQSVAPNLIQATFAIPRVGAVVDHYRRAQAIFQLKQ